MFDILRKFHVEWTGILEDIDHHHDIYMKESEGPAKKKALISIQRALIKCQEIGDEKLCLTSAITEHIENRQRQLEQDRENLGRKGLLWKNLGRKGLLWENLGRKGLFWENHR